MKCESVRSGMPPHINKALLNRLDLGKFDNSSSNFYQYHNFYNILLAQHCSPAVVYNLHILISSVPYFFINIQLCSLSTEAKLAHLRHVIYFIL